MKARAPQIKSRSLPGPKAKAWVARDNAVISTSYTRAYPLVVDHGEGVELTDVDGNVFLDMNAGIAVGATGHSHPVVVKAIQEQAEKFLHMSGTDFYYPQEIQLAERLTSKVPGKKKKRAFLSNSGTEAVECAIKLSRYKTGRSRFIAFYGAFHGRTMGSLSLTASKAIQQKGFAPTMPGVTHVPYADCRRCVFNLKYPDCGMACVKFIEDVVFKKSVPPDDVAAIVVEPIQGEGGYIIPPPGWHQELQKLAKKYGILLVMDEVQSGMGRTGKWFATEHWPGVDPDIVTIAKGIASGLPLGATVASQELMSWPPGSHGNTFGGNPVSCAAANATIRIIEEDGLPGNAEQMGRILRDGFVELKRRFPRNVGDVRGMGLMQAIELVVDETSGDRTPEKALTNRVFEETRKRGLLVGKSGLEGNVFRVAPPLNVTRSDVEGALAIIRESFEAAGAR